MSIADEVLDGIWCECCGEMINLFPLGYPSRCGGCAEETSLENRIEQEVEAGK